MFIFNVRGWVCFESCADTAVRETERNAENEVYPGLYVFFCTRTAHQQQLSFLKAVVYKVPESYT